MLGSCYHRITENSYSLNFNLDSVSCPDGPDPGGCTCENDITWFQCHDAGDMRDKEQHAENHIPRGRLLAYFAINASMHRHIAWIEHCVDPRSERAERVKPFGARPLVILFLEVSICNIVGTAVAKYMAEGVFFGNCTPPTPD